MRHRAKSKEGQWREYVKKRNKYLDEHPNCEHCGKPTECLHHKKGRGIYLSDERYFMATCTNCNALFEREKAWAMSKGYRLDRIGINKQTL